MTVKSSISLTDSQHAFAKALVDSGHFPSVSAVLQQGIELLRGRGGVAALTPAALARLLGERLSGPSVQGKDRDKRLAGMIARKRRAHVARG
ncbi:MAG: type II toxin-antitoxin system ParD family antitoxin [Reyranella sp.]|nr:type II toxin-antitoxin system ParD family antitoxin [Reyranella sp.]